jgi:hypothetical protein
LGKSIAVRGVGRTGIVLVILAWSDPAGISDIYITWRSLVIPLGTLFGIPFIVIIIGLTNILVKGCVRRFVILLVIEIPIIIIVGF